MDEIGELKRGLTSLESDQVPAIIEPVMKQLNAANTELETLKAKLREKAPIVDLQLLRQEVDKKASYTAHETLVKEVENVREKIEEGEKNWNCDQTVLRLMIKEKATTSELNEIANEIRMKVAVDIDKLTSDLEGKAKSVEINRSLDDLRRQA